jgi:hypothetical protein
MGSRSATGRRSLRRSGFGRAQPDWKPCRVIVTNPSFVRHWNSGWSDKSSGASTGPAPTRARFGHSLPSISRGHADEKSAIKICRSEIDSTRRATSCADRKWRTVAFQCCWPNPARGEHLTVATLAFVGLFHALALSSGPSIVPQPRRTRPQWHPIERSART